MMTSEAMRARVLEAKKALIPGRLKLGSGVIGRLFREGVFCASMGWSTDCSCSAKTEFCDAKGRWLKLWSEYHSVEPPRGEYSLIEIWTKGQFEASGLNMRVTLPGGQQLLVGPRGTSLETISGLGELQEDPDDLKVALRAVEAIQRVGKVSADGH